MSSLNTSRGAPMGRRQFLGFAGSRSVALGMTGLALPTLLAACSDDDNGGVVGAGGDGTTTPSEAQAAEEAREIVGDVVDFALTNDEWSDAFGFVTMRLRRGAFDGNDVYFVRTDASDESFAQAEELVHVPKLASLTGDGLSAVAYVVEDASDDQPTVFATEPGRDDYTPAWSLHRVTWSTDRPGPMGFQPSAFDFDAGDLAWSPYWDHYAYSWTDDATARVLRSQTEIHEARDEGELEEFPGVPDTNGTVFTVNCPVPVLDPATFEA